MTLGQKIKALRKSKGLTQEELANKCGLSKNGLWNYENDKREITIETLTKIISVLDLSQEEIYKFINSLYGDLLNQRTATTEKVIDLANQLSLNASDWQNNVFNIQSKPQYLLDAILSYLWNTEKYESSISVLLDDDINDSLQHFTDQQINNIISKVTDLVKYEIYKLEGE